MILINAAEVREEASSTTDLTSVIGTREASRTLRTLAFDATQAWGAILRFGIR
jgi:hypothetical protein